MNDRMNREIEDTISLLQASMPQPQKRRTSVVELFCIAISEMNAVLLLVLLCGAIAVGIMIERGFSSPMLAAFCTAPLPALLLFHRYVLRGNGAMRELEGTFRYSHAEMLVGRTTVISCYMLLVLVALSLMLRYAGGENFIRLALCGAIPSVYLCALLLYLSSTFHGQEELPMIAIILWLALCFAVAILPFKELLQLCSTVAFAMIALIGFALYGVCIHRVRIGGNAYAIGN